MFHCWWGWQFSGRGGLTLGNPSNRTSVRYIERFDFWACF
jgi:hypothetical protein